MMKNRKSTRGSRNRPRRANERDQTSMRVSRQDSLRVPPLRFPPPFAEQMRCSLGYTQTINLASSASANVYGTEIDVNLNSVFQPTSTGGHQPFYLDQIALIYKRYRVDAVKVRVVAFSADPTATDVLSLSALLVSPGVSGTLTGAATDVILEKPNQATVLVQPAGSAAVMQIDIRATIADLCGLTRAELTANVSDYSALITASPNRVPLLMLAAANDSNAVSKTVRIHLFVEYDCEFFERIVPAQS